MKIEIKVFRVFCNQKGDFGNPVGIIDDAEGSIDEVNRQKVAGSLGFSEIVFIDDLDNRQIQIFNPQQQIAFAGHVIVGTAHYLKMISNHPFDHVICKKGRVNAFFATGQTWIEADLEGTPPWNHVELNTIKDLEKIEKDDIRSYKHSFVWTWEDKQKGVIRARTFASDWGIPEDEANGSGSMQLAAKLDRQLEIRHGMGSIIFAEPVGENKVKVGGIVVEDESLFFDL